MRYVLWAGLALFVLGAAAVYWGVHQCSCRPAPVASASRSAPPAATATTPSTPQPCPPACNDDDGQRTVWGAAKDTTTREPERVPEGAYGAPVVVDPPEVIQIQKIDPQLIAAMAKYLTDQRPRLVTEPISAPDTESGEVVVNVLGKAAGAGNPAEECEPVRFMPRCLPEDDPAEPHMPYADEPGTNALFGSQRELAAPACETPTGAGGSGGVTLPVPRMPRADEEAQEMPRAEGCPKDQTSDYRNHHRHNAPSSRVTSDKVELEIPLDGTGGEWAFSYYVF